MSRAAWLAPASLSLAFLALYGATRVEVHRFDAVANLLAARVVPLELDPHHLLYVPLAAALQHLVGPDRLRRALQALSVACAAGTIGVYCALLQAFMRTASAWWAVVGAVLLGVSSSFWISAGETDPYSLTIAALAVAVGCGVRAVEGRGLGWHAAAGLAVAAGTLVHQLVTLFVAVYLLGLALGRARRLASSCLAFLLPAAGIPLLAYLVVAVRQGFGRDLGELLQWSTRAAHGGHWGFFHRDSLVDALYGLLYSLAAGAGGFVPPIAVRAVALVAGIGGAWMLARRVAVESGGRAERLLRPLLASWIAIYFGFVLWWAPFYTVHWEFLLLPLIALGVWVVEGTTRRRGRVAALAALALLTLSIAVLNYVRVIWPLTRPENDREVTFAARTLAALPAGARVIAPVGVPALVIGRARGAGAVFLVPRAPGRGGRSAEVIADLLAFLGTADREGRPVWVFGGLLRATDSPLRVEVRRVLEPLAAERRVSVLPGAELDAPLRRHPLDWAGTRP